MTNKENSAVRRNGIGKSKSGNSPRNREIKDSRHKNNGFSEYGVQNAFGATAKGLPVNASPSRYANVGNETARFTAVAKQPSREERAVIQRRRENAVLSNKRPRAKRKPVMHTLEAREVKPFPWSIVLVSILGTILFMTMIYNNVQINEKTAQIESYNSEVSKLEKGLKDLALELEKKNDLRAIEERALELGMVKSDELSKQYISISPEDKVEIVDEEKEGKRFHFTGIFETIYQKISDFLEFIR